MSALARRVVRHSSIRSKAPGVRQADFVSAACKTAVISPVPARSAQVRAPGYAGGRCRPGGEGGRRRPAGVRHSGRHVARLQQDDRRLLQVPLGGPADQSSRSTIPRVRSPAMYKGQPLDFRGEIYTFGMDTWSRENLHILTSIGLLEDERRRQGEGRTSARSDHDYGMSWIRREERPRLLPGLRERREDASSSNRSTSSSSQALQYALGDLKADDSPSAEGQARSSDSGPPRHVGLAEAVAGVRHG